MPSVTARDGRYLGIAAREDRGLAIRVTDRGKGTEENQDKIFERLTTLEDSRNKKYQGSGLGLTITAADGSCGVASVKSRPYRIVLRCSFSAGCADVRGLTGK